MLAIFLTLSLLASTFAYAPLGSRGLVKPQTSATKLDGMAMKRTFDGKLIMPGEHPEEYVLEMDSGARAVIRTFGCNLFSWIPAGGEEVMGRRADASDITADESPKGYAGGAPHCFPQFGPGALMQHGFARGMLFTPEERAKKVSFDRMIFKLNPTEETKAMWDVDFEYRVDVTLRDHSLEWEVNLINLGDQPYECTLGLHNYYDVSNIDNVVVSGPMGDVRVTGPIDELYPGVQGPVTITDSGKGTRLTLEHEGYSDTKIWNPYGDRNMGFDKFICVEPVQASPVSIPVGKFKQTRFYHKVSYEKL